MERCGWQLEIDNFAHQKNLVTLFDFNHKKSPHFSYSFFIAFREMDFIRLNKMI